MITVVPRGVTPRKHFGASAIGLALWLYGGEGVAAGHVRRAIAGTGDGELRWRTLRRWIEAIGDGVLFRCVRPAPASWSTRQRAERAAATLASYGMIAGDMRASVFDGAARAA